MQKCGALHISGNMAELVLWLSSDKAPFVTGSHYPLDAGYLSQ